MRPIVHLFATCSLILSLSANAQPPTLEERNDSATFVMTKVWKYFFKNVDSSFYYSQKLYQLGEKTGSYPLMNFGLQMTGEAYRGKGNFPLSLKTQLTALKLNRRQKDRRGEAHTLSFIGFTYFFLGDSRRALSYTLPAKKIFDSIQADWIQASFNASNTGACYAMLDQPDSAAYFDAESLRLMELGDEKDVRKLALRTLIHGRLGNHFEMENKLAKAMDHYHLMLHFALQDTISINVSNSQALLAGAFLKQNREDSAIYYARNAILNSEKDRQLLTIIAADTILAAVYKRQGKTDSALHYQTLAMAMKDSVYGIQKFNDLQKLLLGEQEQQLKLIAEKTELRNRLWLSLVAVAAVAFLVVAIVLRRNNRIKQATNLQLVAQKANLESTLVQLRSMQSQLIQSEKMASLGELTAGIAHEIQNPLNFVNNFSEINKELIDELQTELKAGKTEDAFAISNNIKENEEKILHHGKRADAIVKGMRQHSRASTGKKEPTDINALADEYLRLSYHGLRARDKTLSAGQAGFNVILKTDFDESIGKIDIVPQDMGRVILNLVNNAFYAVSEKKNQAGLPTGQAGGQGYEPMVSVRTKKTGDQVLVSVKDNGNGIPQKIVDKIFQPFFTTKPTGQGTGLGLSLAYDIVKAHGGELKVETKEGEGSEFIVQLPAT